MLPPAVRIYVARRLAHPDRPRDLANREPVAVQVQDPAMPRSEPLQLVGAPGARRCRACLVGGIQSPAQHDPAGYHGRRRRANSESGLSPGSWGFLARPQRRLSAIRHLPPPSRPGCKPATAVPQGSGRAASKAFGCTVAAFSERYRLPTTAARGTFLGEGRLTHEANGNGSVVIRYDVMAITIERQRAPKRTAIKAATVRLIGYCRVSTEEQREEGVSLGAQRERLSAYALAHGFEIVQIAEDGGVSGKIAPDERPSLGAALERIRRGEADGLVALKLDRISRSVRDVLALADDAQRRGWRLGLGQRGSRHWVRDRAVHADDPRSPRPARTRAGRRTDSVRPRRHRPEWSPPVAPHALRFPPRGRPHDWEGGREGRAGRGRHRAGDPCGDLAARRPGSRGATHRRNIEQVQQAEPPNGWSLDARHGRCDSPDGRSPSKSPGRIDSAGSGSDDYRRREAMCEPAPPDPRLLDGIDRSARESSDASSGTHPATY